MRKASIFMMLKIESNKNLKFSGLNGRGAPTLVPESNEIPDKNSSYCQSSWFKYIHSLILLSENEEYHIKAEKIYYRMILFKTL